MSQVTVVFSGYDSDVAREKAVDYVTKIYSASIRNMSGTRPHLQHKEPVGEERYHDKTRHTQTRAGPDEIRTGPELVSHPDPL